jgi:DNA-binding XRE family transcriptional regulator
MATKFKDFLDEIEAEAKAEGPEAVAQLEALRDHFRVGRKLVQARLAKKLTQEQVATRARVDQGDISKIERGFANPTFGTLSAVACAVGCEIDVRPRHHVTAVASGRPHTGSRIAKARHVVSPRACR